MDKEPIQSLAACQWVKAHLKILIMGPAGFGIAWLTYAPAHKTYGTLSEHGAGAGHVG